MRVAVLLLCTFMLGTFGSLPAIAQTNAPTIVPKHWQSSHFANNPLVGRVFKGDGKASQEKLLLLQGQLTRFVLLGEQHDNPDHHIIQSNILGALAATGRKPGVVFEMVPASLEAELQNFNLTTDPQLNDLAKRLKWEERGWYSWDIYRPLMTTAIKNSLPLFAGNLDRSKTRALSKEGLKTLKATEVQELGLDAPLPEAVEKIHLADLGGAHCGMMPKTALPSMLNVQRARDGAMANAMVKHSGRFGAVLISGNGHARKDIGVPLVIRTRLPGTREMTVGKSADGRDIQIRVPHAHTFSVGLVEVQEGKVDFNDYSLANANGDALYDFVIFTPKFDTTDHCAQMREQFKNMKKKKTEQ